MATEAGWRRMAAAGEGHRRPEGRELPQGAQPCRHLGVGLPVSSVGGSKRLLPSATPFADVCHVSRGRRVRVPYMAGPGRDSTDTNWWGSVSVGPRASRASVCALSTPPLPLAPATPLGKGMASPRSSELPHRPPVVQEGRKHVGTWQGGCPPWSDLGETHPLPPHPVKTPGSRKVDILSPRLLALPPGRPSFYLFSGLPAACLLLAPSGGAHQCGAPAACCWVLTAALPSGTWGSRVPCTGRPQAPWQVCSVCCR